MDVPAIRGTLTRERPVQVDGFLLSKPAEVIRKDHRRLATLLALVAEREAAANLRDQRNATLTGHVRIIEQMRKRLMKLLARLVDRKRHVIDLLPDTQETMLRHVLPLQWVWVVFVVVDLGLLNGQVQREQTRLTRAIVSKEAEVLYVVEDLRLDVRVRRIKGRIGDVELHLVHDAVVDQVWATVTGPVRL